MKRLIIVGAGGFGREVLSWARCIEPTQDEWRISGFLDGNPVALKPYGIEVPILGDPMQIRPTESDLYICAIGEPLVRKRVVSVLLSKGATFCRLIHPSAIVGLGCYIGVGSILCPNVVLTTNVQLGRFGILNLGATLGHDVIAGDWCTFNVHADVGGNATLGEAVLAGSHAFVLPKVRIGDRVTIGAGSVVTRHVSGDTTVFGIPAQTIYRKPVLSE